MEWSYEAALLIGFVLWAIPYITTTTTTGGRKLPTTKKEI